MNNEELNHEEMKPKGYDHNVYKAFKEDLKSKEPVRKGCLNDVCYCTGACQKIIGWRDPKTGKTEFVKGTDGLSRLES